MAVAVVVVGRLVAFTLSVIADVGDEPCPEKVATAARFRQGVTIVSRALPAGSVIDTDRGACDWGDPPSPTLFTRSRPPDFAKAFSGRPWTRLPAEDLTDSGAYFGAERPFDETWELTVYANSVADYSADGLNADFPADANWVIGTYLDPAGSEQP